jgi:hypothetical protein
MSVPTTEPDIIVAGDTAKWQRSLEDYPANQSWVLTYTLVSTAQRYTFSAAASGADHLVTVAAATTATWVAGTYTWRAQVSKAGEVYTVGTGSLRVRPSFATATDGRSHARKTLEAIEAVIEGRANSEVSYYMIGNRQLRYMTPAELLTLRDRYRAEVAREDAAQRVSAGLPDQRRVYVRFQQ